MGHAENKLKWCLDKAKKESEQGKHRGLVKKEPDINEAKDHIAKAEHDFSAISYMEKGGYSDWSIDAAFYSIYHCFLAIAEKFGYESRNQECTLALVKVLRESGKIDLNEKFVKAIENYSSDKKGEKNLIERREFYAYGTTTDVKNKEEIKRNAELCKECIAQTKKIIFG